MILIMSMIITKPSIVSTSCSVIKLRRMEPKLVTADAVSLTSRQFPNFIGAVLTLNEEGVHAGACYGWTLQYSARTKCNGGCSSSSHSEALLELVKNLNCTSKSDMKTLLHPVHLQLSRKQILIHSL